MRYSEEEKTMWLEDWEQSVKSAWAYARENGLNQQTFINWTKTGNEAKQNFVEVKAISAIEKTTAKQSMGMPQILIKKGDVKIYIPLVISQYQLRAVIEGLGAAL